MGGQHRQPEVAAKARRVAERARKRAPCDRAQPAVAAPPSDARSAIVAPSRKDAAIVGPLFAAFGPRGCEIDNRDPALWALAWLLGCERLVEAGAAGGASEADGAACAGEALGLALLFGGGIDLCAAIAPASAGAAVDAGVGLLSGRAHGGDDVGLVDGALARLDVLGARAAQPAAVEVREVALVVAGALPRIGRDWRVAGAGYRCVATLDDVTEADRVSLGYSDLMRVGDLGLRVAADRVALASARRWRAPLLPVDALIAHLPTAIAAGLARWARDEPGRGPAAALELCRALLLAADDDGLLVGCGAGVTAAQRVAGLWRQARAASGDRALARSTYADGLFAASRLLVDGDLLRVATAFRHHAAAWARWSAALLPAHPALSALRSAEAAVTTALCRGADGEALHLAGAALDEALAAVAVDPSLDAIAWSAHLEEAGHGLLGLLRAERALCDRLASWASARAALGGA